MPGIQIIFLEDTAVSKEEYNQAYYWEEGAAFIKQKIGKKIDVVYCGSDYKGTNRYESLYPEAEVVYVDRKEIPVSSIEIRRDPFGYWDYIPDIVKPYYTKKILLIGGESTGKSTLAQSLALAFNTNFVQETGREICEQAGTEDTMVAEDLQKCLIYQKAEMWKQLEYSNKLLFDEAGYSYVCLSGNYKERFLEAREIVKETFGI